MAVDLDALCSNAARASVKTDGSVDAAIRSVVGPEIRDLEQQLEDWRKGVALVYSAIGEPNPPGLCCATLAEKVLALRADIERLQGVVAATAKRYDSAARYEWLRSHSYVKDGLVEFGPGFNQTMPHALDAAIDDAMRYPIPGDANAQ